MESISSLQTFTVSTEGLGAPQPLSAIDFQSIPEPGGSTTNELGTSKGAPPRHASVKANLPNLQFSSNDLASRIVIHGDLNVSLWDSEFAIETIDSVIENYRAGRHREEHPATPGVPKAVLSRDEDRGYHLLLRNATLVVEAVDRPYQVHVASATSQLNGDITLLGAVGELRFNGATAQVKAPSAIQIDDSSLSMSMAPALLPDGTLGMSAAFHGEADQITFSGQTFDLSQGSQATTNVSAFTAPVIWTAGVSLATLGAAVALVARHRRRAGDTTIIFLDASDAFADEDYETALRQSKRLLDDEEYRIDGAVLHAAALLKVRDSETARRFLDEMSPKVPEQGRMLLQIMKGVCLLGEAQDEAAAAAIEGVVKRQPALLEEFRGTDAYARIVSAMQRRRPAGDQAYV